MKCDRYLIKILTNYFYSFDFSILTLKSSFSIDWVGKKYKSTRTPKYFRIFVERWLYWSFGWYSLHRVFRKLLKKSRYFPNLIIVRLYWFANCSIQWEMPHHPNKIFIFCSSACGSTSFQCVIWCCLLSDRGIYGDDFTLQCLFYVNGWVLKRFFHQLHFAGYELLLRLFTLNYYSIWCVYNRHPTEQ